MAIRNFLMQDVLERSETKTEEGEWRFDYRVQMQLRIGLQYLLEIFYKCNKPRTRHSCVPECAHRHG